eukprot:11683369-Alexandrium_andersonii.AAC.1
MRCDHDEWLQEATCRAQSAVGRLCQLLGPASQLISCLALGCCAMRCASGLDGVGVIRFQIVQFQSRKWPACKGWCLCELVCYRFKRSWTGARAFEHQQSRD